MTVFVDKEAFAALASRHQESALVVKVPSIDRDDCNEIDTDILR